MFLKIAIRNIWKRKIFTLINVFGLSIGMAACLMIYLYVADELSYDRSYPESDRIFRVAREHGEGGEKQGSAAVNYLLGDLIRTNLSGVETLTRFSAPNEVKVLYNEGIYHENRAHYADQEFFSIFGIKFIEGGQANALVEPFTVVLTEEISKKLFGDQGGALDKILSIDGNDYRVTGVVEALPTNVHLRFDYLLSLESTRSFYGDSMFEHWGNIWIYTYARLSQGADPDSFEAALNQMAFDHGPEALQDFGVRFFLQPVSDIHLKSRLNSELGQNGDEGVLKILVAVAILILTIACFNFINLTTARSAWRSKEIGVKKVLGVRRPELIFQFLGESILITLISLGFTLILVATFQPFLNVFTGKTTSQVDILNSLPLILGFAVVVGALAGLIPSLLLSSFQPGSILKGQSSQGNTAVAAVMRQVLIVIQFSISVILIIGTVVIFQQLSYVKSKDLGVDIDKVIVLRLKNQETREKMDVLKSSISAFPEVTSISAASNVPFERLNSWRVRRRGAAEPHELISVMAVDQNYLQSLNILTSSNSVFSGEEFENGRSIIVNEAFVDHYQITDPVGTSIEIGHMEDPVTILAVVKDFHFASLHEVILPVMLYPQSSWYQKLVIKVSSTNFDHLLESIEAQWKEIHPAEEFDYYFLDESFKRLYASEEKTGSLIAYFSILSIFIACLGLYGLASYVAEAKIKEISVRKILGASIPNLIGLQFGIFLKLLVVAGLLAVPVGYILMSNWLQNFSYSIQVEWWVMAIAIMAVLVFAIVSVGYRSLTAAQANPAENLRNE